MSDTKKHKDKGKFKNGIIDISEVCESTKQMWNRHNGERGENRCNKKYIEEKIMVKELKKEIELL